MTQLEAYESIFAYRQQEYIEQQNFPVPEIWPCAVWCSRP